MEDQQKSPPTYSSLGSTKATFKTSVSFTLTEDIRREKYWIEDLDLSTKL